MARHQHYPARPRTVASIADARDLRSAISAVLVTQPPDERALRQAVWAYVGTERDAGVSPGHVVLSLTELIDHAPVTPAARRETLTRDVILWCVEAYFGHLGGDVFRVSGAAAGVPPSSARPGAAD